MTARAVPFLVLALGLALSACQTAAPPPPAADAPRSPVTPSGFTLPSGEGCAGEVARFRAVMDNDLATGHTTKGVHERVTTEIASADAACKSGNAGGAVAQIRATKAKFGYR